MDYLKYCIVIVEMIYNKRFDVPLSLTFTYCPLKSVTSGVKRPDASTGHTTASPFLNTS